MEWSDGGGSGGVRGQSEREEGVRGKETRTGGRGEGQGMRGETRNGGRGRTKEWGRRKG